MHAYKELRNMIEVMVKTFCQELFPSILNLYIGVLILTRDILGIFMLMGTMVLGQTC